MKKLIYILVVLVMGRFANAQTFTVGNTCCNYFYANSTFTTPTVYGLYSDFYYLDIDGDMNNDIGIRSQHFSCQIVPSGPCTGQWGNDITISLGANTEFAYASVTTASCSYGNIIKNLSLGTALNSSLNWSLTSAPNSVPTIFSAGVGYYCGQQVNPFYVGFRKILTGNDTIYGWLKLDSNFPGKVIDYAYKKTSTTTNITNIASNLSGLIDVYPNPAIDKLNIHINDFDNSKQYKLKLVSVEGKELKSAILMNAQTEIDVNDLSAGFYFVEIGFEKNLIRRKLVISTK